MLQLVTQIILFHQCFVWRVNGKKASHQCDSCKVSEKLAKISLSMLHWDTLNITACSGDAWQHSPAKKTAFLSFSWTDCPTFNVAEEQRKRFDSFWLSRTWEFPFSISLAGDTAGSDSQFSPSYSLMGKRRNCGIIPIPAAWPTNTKTVSQHSGNSLLFKSIWENQPMTGHSWYQWRCGERSRVTFITNQFLHL